MYNYPDYHYIELYLQLSYPVYNPAIVMLVHLRSVFTNTYSSDYP